MKKISVQDVMMREPVCVFPDAKVFQVLEQMNQKRIGAVLVTDEDQKLLGIFTERDFLRHAINVSNSNWENVVVADWMSPQPYTISPQASWEDAFEGMDRLRVRHLPVVDQQKVIGIVSSRILMKYRGDILNQAVQQRVDELKQLNEQLIARDSELTYYLKTAARLQRQLVLPKQPPQWQGFTWGIHFAPLDPLGGDFYDFIQHDDNHLGVLIADVSGHGLPAAMIAILTRFVFQEIATRSLSTGQVLATINQRVCTMLEERFVTAFYAIFNRQNQQLTYSNAGHPFPCHYIGKTGSTNHLSARGYPLGIAHDEVYREKTIDFEKGDRIAFYTDGIIDCCNERGESFGDDRFMRILQENGSAPTTDLSKKLLFELKQFQGNCRAIDDVTLLLMGIDV